MDMRRLITVLVITNVWANGEADGFLGSVSVGWWETGGDVDGYDEASGYIAGYEDLLIMSDRRIDGDVEIYQSTLSQINLSAITGVSTILKENVWDEVITWFVLAQ